MRTNEQAVVAAKVRISELKSDYNQALTAYIKSRESSDDEKLARFLECQQKGTAFFNFIENFVGDSDLLGAHRNGLWVTGFAEDCFSHLESLIEHFQFLRARAKNHPDIAGRIEPCATAFANMQRMVVEYLPTDMSNDLRQKFVENGLPIMGFDMPAAQSALPRWQIITGLVVGLFLVIVSTAIAILIPDQTITQQFVFRGVLAIGLAAMTPIIPGFVNLTSKIGAKGSYLKIVAGGSVAIFVLIWMTNPPRL